MSTRIKWSLILSFLFCMTTLFHLPRLIDFNGEKRKSCISFRVFKSNLKDFISCKYVKQKSDEGFLRIPPQREIFYLWKEI